MTDHLTTVPEIRELGILLPSEGSHVVRVLGAAPEVPLPALPPPKERLLGAEDEPDAAETAGPTPSADRVDGIDIYEGNAMPPPERLRTLGIWFVIHKASDGAGHLDRAYQQRRDAARGAGLVFGAYQFFRFWTAVDRQVQRFTGVVQRLVPGELGPTLDFEHQSWNDPRLGHANPMNPWTPRQWVDAIQRFFDGVESALGRTPMIYTSHSVWREAVDASNHRPLADTDTDPDTSLLGYYPLWVVMYYDPPSVRFRYRLTHRPDQLRRRPLPTPWSDWAFWQYSDERPAELPGLAHGTDMDVGHGTVHWLRGMADLEHTAPHVSGRSDFVAYTQPDGRLHLLTGSGGWTDRDLLDQVANAPLAAGDPAAAVVGGEQVVLFRDRTGHLQALTRSLASGSAPWTLTDVSRASGAEAALDDPFVAVVQNQLHAVYWGARDRQVHLSLDGGWHAETFAGAPAASGSAALYLHDGVVRVVARAGGQGELFDAAGTGAAVNLTADAHATLGRLPAATYRPTVYTRAGAAPRIVFRAVRGDLWQIARDTMIATNLSVAAGHAPPAAGSPAAVVSDTVHIFYRALDRHTVDTTIMELFDDAGTWRRRTVRCDAVPAGDPTGFLNARGQTAVSFRATDGSVHVATLMQHTWVCQDTARPQAAPTSRASPGG